MDFNSLKDTFLEDSKLNAADKGLEWKSHFDTFIQYTQAKLLEQMIIKLDEIKEKIPSSFGDL